MNGGAGDQTDVHRFTDLDQLGLGSTRNILINFVPGTDTIDVSAIDAAAMFRKGSHSREYQPPDYQAYESLCCRPDGRTMKGRCLAESGLPRCTELRFGAWPEAVLP